MKRLVGVIILAGAPIACGTSTPSAPGATSLLSDTDATMVSSQALGKRPAPTCTPGDRSQVRSIAVKIVVQGPGFATVRAVVDSSSTDPVVPVCLEPSWLVTPNARLDRTIPEQATILAAPGRYLVKATTVISKQRKPLSATAIIVIE